MYFALAACGGDVEYLITEYTTTHTHPQKIIKAQIADGYVATHLVAPTTTPYAVGPNPYILPGIWRKYTSRTHYIIEAVAGGGAAFRYHVGFLWVPDIHVDD
jgi:hypothetical protein